MLTEFNSLNIYILHPVLYFLNFRIVNVTSFSKCIHHAEKSPILLNKSEILVQLALPALLNEELPLLLVHLSSYIKDHLFLNRLLWLLFIVCPSNTWVGERNRCGNFSKVTLLLAASPFSHLVKSTSNSAHRDKAKSSY